ncbi:MAG: acyltransferase family protein, partial [Chitinophagaceae bacterium]
ARYFVWRYQVHDLAYASLYTFTRIDGLCIGSIVALLQKIRPDFLKKNMLAIVLLMAGINFGFYFINNRSGFTLPYLAFVGYTTFAVIFGLLVYESVSGEPGLIHRLLGFRPLRYFGKISYGLYVYHWPVYLILFHRILDLFIQNHLLAQRAAELCSGIAVTLIAVGISELSYRYVERPFLRLKTKFV